MVATVSCAPAVPARPPGDVGPVPTAAPISAATPASEQQQVLSDARGFVFRVRNQDCLSTGTAFTFAGRVVTNRHVAAGAAHLQLASWDGQDFSASVAGHSSDADLAVLNPGIGYPPATAGAAGSDPTVGEKVFATGYPEGDQLTVSAGTVTGSETGADLGVSGEVILFNAEVQPGNSGSPLLDGGGRVVGVVFAKDTSNGEGLAIPVSTLEEFLGASPARSRLPCAP